MFSWSSCWLWQFWHFQAGLTYARLCKLTRTHLCLGFESTFGPTLGPTVGPLKSHLQLVSGARLGPAFGSTYGPPKLHPSVFTSSDVWFVQVAFSFSASRQIKEKLKVRRIPKLHVEISRNCVAKIKKSMRKHVEAGNGLREVMWQQNNDH